MIQVLTSHANDIRFARIVALALNFLASAKIERESGPTMLRQSSQSVAELHAFRKRSGYYKEGAAVGLDESIEALSERDVAVRAGLLETDQAYVAMWLDEQDALLGVMIFSTNSARSRSMESIK